MTNAQESVKPQQVKPLGGGYFSDKEIIEAFAVWVAGCGSLPSQPSLRGLVTVGEALEADTQLRLALLVQAEDLTRLIETTRFRPGIQPLLAGAWGQPAAPSRPA